MKLFFFFMALILVSCSGCETISGQQRRLAETRTTSEVASLKVSIQRMEQRISGLETDREMLHSQMADLQAGMTQSDARLRAEFASIDAQSKAQSAALVKMRSELADELSGRVAKLIQTQKPASTVRSQAGREHVVKPGETLSEIARAYGVSIPAITKANSMKDPNDLRVGQTLFIPD